MDRMVPVKIGGQDYFFNFSIEVMFEMIERWGGVQAALDALGEESVSGFEAVKWWSVRLARDGELCRRDAGYDHGRMISENDISMRMSPLDFAELKNAVVTAITRGYKRETESTEEVDLGLEELRQKKDLAGG